MTMSYKSYMEEVAKRLQAMTTGELRQLILHWAEQKKPEGRRFFLDQLKKPSKVKSSTDDDRSVIDAVRKFCKQISDGEYLDEDEWQDDEFDGVADDESWVEEMDGFLAEARQRMMNRQYETARQIYDRQPAQNQLPQSGHAACRPCPDLQQPGAAKGRQRLDQSDRNQVLPLFIFPGGNPQGLSPD